MADRRTDNLIKFGPEWLRNTVSATTTSSNTIGTVITNTSRQSSVTTSTSSALAHQPGPPRHVLADHRYGAEEMLVLFDETFASPPELQEFETLYISLSQPPLALSNEENEPNIHHRLDKNYQANRGHGSPVPVTTTQDGYPGGTAGPGSMIDRRRGTPGGTPNSRGGGRIFGYTSNTSHNPGRTTHGIRIFGDSPHSDASSHAQAPNRSWNQSNGSPTNPRPSREPNDWNNKDHNAARNVKHNRWDDNSNWRRKQQMPSTSRGFGDESEGGWRSNDPNQNRQNNEKRGEWNRERHNNWNRRAWSGDSQASEDHLPEWAVENNVEGGGTFDSLGAFHGISNDDSIIGGRPAGETFYGLSRSHTQGHLTNRKHTTDEPTEDWWASEKAKKLQPPKLPTVDLKYGMSIVPKFDEKPVSVQDENQPSSAGSNEQRNTNDPKYDTRNAGDSNAKPQVQQPNQAGLNTESRRNEPSKDQKSLRDQQTRIEEEEPTRDTKNNTPPQQEKAKEPQLEERKVNFDKGETKEFDALLRQNINIDEANDDGKGFRTVIINNNNSLRQRHQNIVSIQAQPEAVHQILQPLPLQHPTVQQLANLPVPAKSESPILEDFIKNLSLVAERSPRPNFDIQMEQPNSSWPPAEVNHNIAKPKTDMSVFLTPPQPRMGNPLSMHNPSNPMSFQSDAEKWYYEDPQEKTQGPFSAIEMTQWYNNGFFSSNLRVRRGCEATMKPLWSYGPYPPFLVAYPPSAKTPDNAIPMEQSRALEPPNPIDLPRPQISIQKPQESPMKALLGGYDDFLIPQTPNTMGLLNNTMADRSNLQSLLPQSMSTSSQFSMNQYGSMMNQAYLMTSDMSTPNYTSQINKSDDKSSFMSDMSANIKPTSPWTSLGPWTSTPTANPVQSSHTTYSPTTWNASPIQLPEKKELPDDKFPIEEQLFPASSMSFSSVDNFLKKQQVLNYTGNLMPKLNLSNSNTSTGSMSFPMPPPQEIPMPAKLDVNQQQIQPQQQNIESDKSAALNETKGIQQPVEQQDKTTQQPKKDKVKGKGKAKETVKEKSKDEENTSNEWKDNMEGFLVVKGSDKNKDRKAKQIQLAQQAQQTQEEIAKKKKEEDELVRKYREQEILKKQADGVRRYQEELRVQQQRQQRNQMTSMQQQNPPPPKAAPWLSVGEWISQAHDAERVSLLEIQRMERENKQKEQQQQLAQEQQQQQQAAAAAKEQESIGTWKITPKPFKFTDLKPMSVVMEEIKALQAAQGIEPNSQAPWKKPNGVGGFWDSSTAGQPSLQRPIGQKSQTRPATSSGTSSNSVMMEGKGKKKVVINKENTPEALFEYWCAEALKPFETNLDVPMFTDFLKNIESPYDVKDYVKLYLGDGKEASDFSKQFLEQRSKLLRASSSSVSVDDLCRPAPAVTPSTGDFQEVKGKGKKVKKNKMLKVDARILGFSVTAAEDRINVGDIDSV